MQTEVMIQIESTSIGYYHISAFESSLLGKGAAVCLIYYLNLPFLSLPTTEEAVSSYQPVTPVAHQIKSIVTPPPQSRTHIRFRAASLRLSMGHCPIILMI